MYNYAENTISSIKINSVKIYDNEALVYSYEAPMDLEKEARRNAMEIAINEIESTLEPCPFCNGKAELNTHFSTVYERIYGEVTCTKCGVSKRGVVTFDTYDATYRGIDTEEWVDNAHIEAARSARDEWNGRM